VSRTFLKLPSLASTFTTVALLRCGPLTVKLELLVAVPPCVVTAIGPVVAPAGTVALIDVLSVTVNVVAAFPLKLAVAAGPKPVPVTVTDVPTGPLVGEKPVTVGAATVTLELLAPVTAAPATDTPLPASRSVITATGELRHRRKQHGA
jgi:hypothetical protein